MYHNYGDRNFFEHGILVDTDHSDTEFQMLRCLPYPDEEDKYMFSRLDVDITDSWIDRKAVLSFLGMTEETFDPVQFAIGCTDYYSWDNFGASDYGDWQDCTADYIVANMQGYMIAHDEVILDPDGV